MKLKLFLFIFCCLLFTSACKTNNKALMTSAAQDKNITEKYWKLVRLNGKKFVMNESLRREPFLIFKVDDNRVNGFSGCNMLNGYYTMNGNNLTFSRIVTTMMSCEGMETEKALMKVFDRCNNYSLSSDGKTLFLNGSSRTPLAHFEVVYLR